MPWKRYDFKGQEVYVRVLPGGKPIVHRERVELRYKLGATKSYRGSPENLTEIGGETVTDAEMSGSPAGAARAKGPREAPSTPADENTIVVYTDGACSGNPGPAGIGVYLERPGEIVEHAEFIGSATNNIAELRAILKAIELLREDEKDATIHLYTDSGWSLGVLDLGWKAKANLEWIEKIQEARKPFEKLELIKVQGHAGIAGNEEADGLATMAVRREDSRTRTRKKRR